MSRSCPDYDVPTCWPALPLPEWHDTCDTLHMWTQVVGKLRMALTPLVNHWWNVALYVDARGLTTSPMPWRDGAIELRFDFVDHALVLHASDGGTRSFALVPMSVADFYRKTMDMLASAGIEIGVDTMPSEVPDPIPFERDAIHASYDRIYAERFWRILVTLDRVFGEFRSGFVGKCSPVHFFWGSFDFAVTRFSGRRAPERPGADAITREAYSHEVSSVGFWPGGGGVPDAAFYAYAAPEPKGFRDHPIRPAGVRYESALGEFILMYEDVRHAHSPSAALLEFCESTYVAAANLGGWDRKALER